MARLFIEFYSSEVRGVKEAFYSGLGEKARRHFLGQEYSELDTGSQWYLSRVFGCSRNTVLKGYKEVNNSSFFPDYTNQRSAGAGKKEEELAFLTQTVLDYVADHTAGSPTDPLVKWTALSAKDIATHLKEEHKIAISHETADFVVDNLRWWWLDYGQFFYQDATHILLLCDCGGVNGYRHRRFKVLLQRLARQIGIRIVVAHYPPYCSKFNPIERRLFCHVQHTIKNTILTDIEQTAELMSKTSHKKGLTAEVRIVKKFYPLKQPSDKEDIDESRILKHPDLPQFSYTILP